MFTDLTCNFVVNDYTVYDVILYVVNWIHIDGYVYCDEGYLTKWILCISTASSDASEVVRMNLTLPKNVVPDSARTFVSVIGNFMLYNYILQK